METTPSPERSSLFTPPQTSVEDSLFLIDDSLPDGHVNHDFRRIVCLHCSHVIDIPVYCGNRWCEICGRPRAVRVRRRIQFCVDHTPKLKGYRWKFLTLTIANRPDLKPMIAHLLKSFRRLRQRKLWKELVSGGCFVVEVTGHRGNWHAHIHAIIYAQFIDWRQLLNLWKKVSGGSHIDIRQVPAKAAIGYVTDYCTKHPVLDPPELLECAQALKNLRLFNPFGSWYSMAREYVKAKSGCPQCGMSDWMPLDVAWNAAHGSDAWIVYHEVQYRRLKAGLNTTELPPQYARSS